MANFPSFWSKFNHPLWLMGILLSTITVAVLTQHTHSPRTKHKPSAFDVTIVQPSYKWTNDQGLVRGSIVAKSANYSTKSFETRLHFPEISSQDNENNLWHMTSEHGQSFQVRQMVHLWDHVIITKGQKDDPASTIIQTQSITILPQKEKAYTNDKVILIQGNHQIQSYGVTIDMKNGIIHLLSNARGIYEPS